ncbi:MAG TPA: NAD(P)-dependent oxidoreductase [Alphaproteobacteria bacterium]|jgi:nucleoside-diphosphate-sugar epimerase|nr:NAD(P)-dependent oxidoreductase [Alphaproteobacteria bacterium]HJO89225.1 NAD(P)-dependent oxidoreductase [Alphaproteobacteria bacterium]|tara:strand:- start:505 stop:1344 length:840 start_codon:yes stop_codon:yes gene_type:complete
MGAGGFVGGQAAAKLEADGILVLRLTRSEVDLLVQGAAEKLAGLLESRDCLIVVSAIAPCKNAAMLADNMAMMGAVCSALEKTPVAHVIYISSDAVYNDSDGLLSEDSVTAPDNLHGIMHVARELMLKSVVGETPLAILRPSLLYGLDDPHNGYGPNSFRRLAAKGEDITLFGEGEERRDHVLIEDLADIIRLVALHRSKGVLTVATGEVVSFKDMAEMVVARFDEAVVIKGSPRKGPMPHNGYRPFDVSATRDAFPEFRYTLPSEGIARVHSQMTAGA